MPLKLQLDIMETWLTHTVVERANSCAHDQKDNSDDHVFVFCRAWWQHFSTRKEKTYQSFQRSRQHWCVAFYVVNKVCNISLLFL